MIDTKFKSVRSSAILTNSYVAGTLIDGAFNYTDLTILANFTKGSLTDAQIKVEFANTVYYDLAYSSQSANYTVGKTLTGSQSGAKGTIIADNDGGTTGTLTLQLINNITFINGEIITDDNGTPGSATVNGAISVSSNTFFQEVETAKSAGVITETLASHKMTATGKYSIPVPLKGYRYILISAIGTGTVTSSALSIDALLSGDQIFNQ